ncbi:bifunctional DNA-binding transcriptional regulator/O6-methylguanine-DNA methyltransferase Ada [Uliginosibacterium sp. sgz301328]|uniref:bifunctional DNA-binding transcriptional regulator/O6-methylguanine-DNA methyltransferase Ada n=1 Tax=Uliginosibacterium sp. sgz301328 TaxID=3243764 RepID=UPI00359DCFB3
MSRHQTPSSHGPDDDAHWADVEARNARADGLFFYAVRTTGVYCRPSCGARTPRRENVRFFATADEAEAAGFRPCKRCRPRAGSATGHAELMAELCRYIEAADTPPSLAQLSAKAGLSAYHLQRVFKSIVGLTPREFARAKRAQRLRGRLPSSSSVTTALYEAGYGSSGRLYEESAQVLGMSPKHYRQGGRDQRIRFGIGQCSLGAILVAASETGVCAILLGDDPDALARALQDAFPRAELIGGDAAFEDWMARVIGFIDVADAPFELPLDLRGTAFQQRVWAALQRVPPGTTVTYTELAQRIGAPRAIRAVAAACAANTLAVAIPCHRVIRLDGSLAGYRWGVARKRALLEREAGASRRRDAA